MSHLALFGSHVHYYTVAASYGQVILLWLAEQPDRRTDDLEIARRELRLDPMQFAMGIEWCRGEGYVLVYPSMHKKNTQIAVIIDMGSLDYRPANDAFRPQSIRSLHDKGDEEGKREASNTAGEDNSAAESSKWPRPRSLDERLDSLDSFRRRSYSSGYLERHPALRASPFSSSPDWAKRHERRSRRLDDDNLRLNRTDWPVYALIGAMVFLMVALLPGALDSDPTLEADAAVLFVTVLVLLVAFAVGMGLSWLSLIAYDWWRKRRTC